MHTHTPSWMLFGLALAVYMLPLELWAQPTLNATVGVILCDLVAFLKGQGGRTIAVAAIIFMAVGVFFGKTTWGTTLATATAIGALFSADAIVTGIAGLLNINIPLCPLTSTTPPPPPP